jgi:phosphoglycolate phosphatase-like HAD superfamily hydrolase
MTNRIQGIQLVITDLDNTLYDWYAWFIPAFYAMVDAASNILDVDKERLLDELKSVHVHYHNSEQPFAILETPTVERKLPKATRLQRKQFLDRAFDAFRQVRNQNLRLFPGVRDSLREIRKTGCSIVGHTEAVLENGLYRLELLNLIEEFHRLYAPASRSNGHPDPARPRIEERYSRFVSILPVDHRKPDPIVLKEICESFKVRPDKTLYIGDSMTRDISMAILANTHSAFAAYGGKCPRDMWRKLVRVTHWTDEDVSREERLREEFAGLEPDVELNSFSDVMRYFDFESNPANEGLRARAGEPALSLDR